MRGGGSLNTSRCNGFTLAEILITLAVIGIVAVMTIPALVRNYRKKITTTRMKVAYSQFIQAIQLSEIDNGTISGWDYPETTSSDATRDFITKYFKPYMKLSECLENTDEACGAGVGSYDYQYKLANGSSIAIEVGCNIGAVYEDGEYIAINFDVNGPQGPNVGGIDAFYFGIRKENDYRLLPAPWTPTVTREDILNGTYVWMGEPCLCKDIDYNDADIAYYQQTRCCGLLLFLDNFEIKDDYPISYYNKK